MNYGSVALLKIKQHAVHKSKILKIAVHHGEFAHLVISHIALLCCFWGYCSLCIKPTTLCDIWDDI